MTLGNSFKPPRASVSSSVEWGDNCGTHAWVLPPPTGLAPLRAAQCHRWSERRCGTGGGTGGCLGLRHELSPPPLRRDSRHRRNAARGRGCVPTQLLCAMAGGRGPPTAGCWPWAERTPHPPSLLCSVWGTLAEAWRLPPAEGLRLESPTMPQLPRNAVPLSRGLGVQRQVFIGGPGAERSSPSPRWTQARVARQDSAGPRSSPSVRTGRDRGPCRVSAGRAGR